MENTNGQCKLAWETSKILSFVDTSQFKLSNGLQFCVTVAWLSRLEKTKLGEPGGLLGLMFQIIKATYIWYKKLPVRKLIEWMLVGDVTTEKCT